MKMSQVMVGMIAVVAIGVFALPTTLSVGQGQHTFKQINVSDPSAFCAKCHGLTGDPVQAELNNSDKTLYYSAAGTNGSGVIIHHDQTCGDCHALAAGYGNGAVNATNRSSAKTEHAAVIPSCLDCHTGDDTNDVTQELNSTTEAHRPLWVNSSSQTVKDLACLGCHTGVAKSGTPAYNYSITNGTTIEGINIGW